MTDQDNLPDGIATLAEIESAISACETKIGFSSEEFLRRRKQGLALNDIQLVHMRTLLNAKKFLKENERAYSA